MNKNPRLRAVLRLGLGLAILAGVVWIVEPEPLIRQFRELDGGLALLGLFQLLLAITLVEPVRLWLTFRRMGLHLPTALDLGLTAAFFGSVTGSQLGAEAWRLHRLSHLGAGLAAPIALLAVLRAASIMVVIGLTILWVLVAPEQLSAMADRIGLDRAAELDPAQFLIALIAVAVLAWIFRRRYAGRVGRTLERMIAAVKDLRPPEWVALVGLGGVSVLLRVTAMACFIRAMGDEIGLLDPLPALFLALAASILPISPANLGVREGAFVIGLHAVGVPAASGLAAALLNRLAVMTAGAMGGLSLLLGLTRREGSEPDAR